MELPHDSNGDVDWKTLGNILTADILGEVLHAKFVDYKYGQVSKDTHNIDTSWQFCYEEDGVIVLKKVFSDSSLQAFMGRGIIELPVTEVFNFIRNLSHRHHWDKHLVNIEILRKFSKNDFLVRMHHKARQCLVSAERDFVYYERAGNADGKFVMTALSVSHPEFPPKPGLIRAQILSGSGWVLEPYDNSSSVTLVSYLAHLDLVALPPIIINRTLRRQVMAVKYIRNILTPPSPHPPQRAHSSSLRRKKVVGGRDDNKGQENGDNIVDVGDFEFRRGRELSESGVHYEDPVAVHVFTKGHRVVKRIDSVPWDIHHRWSGDNHGHTHQEAAGYGVDLSSGEAGRGRSCSDGTTMMFNHPSIWAKTVNKEDELTIIDKQSVATSES